MKLKTFIFKSWHNKFSNHSTFLCENRSNVLYWVFFGFFGNFSFFLFLKGNGISSILSFTLFPPLEIIFPIPPQLFHPQNQLWMHVQVYLWHPLLHQYRLAWRLVFPVKGSMGEYFLWKLKNFRHRHLHFHDFRYLSEIFKMPIINKELKKYKNGNFFSFSPLNLLSWWNQNSKLFKNR